LAVQLSLITREAYADIFENFTMEEGLAWDKFKDVEPNYVAVLNAFNLINSDDHPSCAVQREKDFAKYVGTVRNLVGVVCACVPWLI
jgi:hypothetical protein